MPRTVPNPIVHHALGNMVINGMTASMVDVSQARSQMLRNIGRIFANRRVDTERKKRMHAEIGQRGQRAVLNSYAQAVTAHKKVPSYRVGGGRKGRYAGGALRRAIGQSNFYEATATGLNFINRNELDKEAAHWHRLNFGAGDKAGKGRRAQVFQVRWGGLVAATLGLEDGPSPAFGLPVGFWIGGEGAAPGSGIPRVTKFGGGSHQAFYPTGTTQRFPTDGIAARRFLDTGVREIARELPRAYEGYYREIYAEAKKDPTSRLRIYTTVSPRPQGHRMRRFTLSQ